MFGLMEKYMTTNKRWSELVQNTVKKSCQMDIISTIYNAHKQLKVFIFQY